MIFDKGTKAIQQRRDNLTEWLKQNFLKCFINLLLAVLDRHCCSGFSLVAVSKGPLPGGLPDPRIKPRSLTSPALARRFSTTSTLHFLHYSVHRGTQTSRCSGLSCCGAWALGRLGCGSCGMWAREFRLPGSRAQVQQLWHIGLGALQHVGSSWARDRTCVPSIGRQTPDHCTTRKSSYPHIFNLLVALSYYPHFPKREKCYQLFLFT